MCFKYTTFLFETKGGVVMRGKQIMTVTGPVNANLLGTVYSHEHLIVQPQIPDEKYIAYTLSDENASAKKYSYLQMQEGRQL